jgi:hypothetical protein
MADIWKCRASSERPAAQEGTVGKLTDDGGTKNLVQDAMDFLAAHSCVELPNPKQAWPATFHCKCGAEMTAKNLDLMTNLFVQHIVILLFERLAALQAEREIAASGATLIQKKLRNRAGGGDSGQ